MKKRWVSLRNALMAATFLASTGFGAFQVMASITHSRKSNRVVHGPAKPSVRNSAATWARATSATAAVNCDRESDCLAIGWSRPAYGIGMYTSTFQFFVPSASG